MVREWLTGGYRTVKGRKSDGMGSENEQYTIVCKGDCGCWIDFCISLMPSIAFILAIFGVDVKRLSNEIVRNIDFNISIW